jgi:hypothetical protein
VRLLFDVFSKFSLAECLFTLFILNIALFFFWKKGVEKRMHKSMFNEHLLQFCRYSFSTAMLVGAGISQVN